MISIEKIAVFIPKNSQPVLSLQKQTNLPRNMLAIYAYIYGLKNVSLWQKDISSLLAFPLEEILAGMDRASVDYLLHLHTADFVSPYGESIVNQLKNAYGLFSAIAWSTTGHKCASFFKALELMKDLLNENQKKSAILLTGEVAFTSDLRVVPRMSLVGDAASACLISNQGENHFLLYVINRFYPGFSEGLDVTAEKMKSFDLVFIPTFSQFILDSVISAGLSLDKITLILPHNINIPTWKKIATALFIPFEKIFTPFISQYGHCFCSDQLINLDGAIKQGFLKKGDYYVMAGCGLGIHLSAAVFQY